MAEADATTTKPLPAEVLTKIFEHCQRPNLTELVNIVDVCQLSRDVAMREYNTSGNDLVIRNPDDINDFVSLLCKPVRFSKLHVVWDVTSDVDYRSVSLDLDALANVTSLTHLQSFVFKVKDGGYNSCNRILAALLTLLILPASTDTLTHLRLFNTGWHVGIKVVDLLEACQHLSHLVLNRCDLFDYEDQQRLVDIIPTLTHLKLLDLRGTELPRNLSFIEDVKRGCPNIFNNIMTGGLEIEPSDDVRFLQFVSHVDRLHICSLDTEQLTLLISSLNECVSQLSVDKLWVYDCKDHVTDDILLSLVQRLRGVKEVRVNFCGGLTNIGVVNVIRSSPQLETISVRGIKNIDTGIIQLLDLVVTEQSVNIEAYESKLSEQMNVTGDGRLYTGVNRNICLEYT